MSAGAFHLTPSNGSSPTWKNDCVRRAAYTRDEYWDERLRMMQFWSGELDRLRSGAKLLKPNFGGRRPAAG
jgi:hypothetical protein